MTLKFRLLLLLVFVPGIVFSQALPIQLKFENGHVKGSIKSKSGEKEFTLDALIPSTRSSATVLVSADSDRIITKKQINYFDNACEITSIIKRTTYGLQWDIDIIGRDSDWTAPIETTLQWKNPAALQFWTTWADNHLNPKADEWQNPFIPALFQNLNLIYGGETHRSHDAFVIPIATTFFEDDDIGLSFIRSLNDTIFDLKLHTSANGEIAYRNLNYRINGKHTIHICHQIVVHVADWRAGVAFMAKNYPSYFLPEEPLVNKMAGCGAYSSYEGDPDTAKYNRMGFSINWKASLDFPYMGMFIPPVKSDYEQWTKYKQRGVMVGNGKASIRKLNEYSAHLKKMGYYTLSYFNVTEFGNGIVYPYKGKVTPGGKLWEDPNKFVYTRLKTAFLKPSGSLPDWDDRPLYSNWEDCVVLDPADSAYKSLLLEQAKLNIEKTPASSGICIDRLDWMRFYNSNGDDKMSMVDKQRTRAMLLSWKGIMEPVSQIMHGAHKVIFCNPLDRRIDLLNHIDGIYDEFGYLPSSLNLCAQMAFFKPIIAWTASKDDLMPDPDAFFQRYLFMGTFLTVPYPGNDHCITPDATADKYYFDYGLLLSALKGREWVLQPHVLAVENSKAIANVFKANGKIIVPLVFGESDDTALVTLKFPYNLLEKKELEIKVLYPGSNNWKKLTVVKYSKVIKLNVPMKRGCAMISIG